MQIIETMLESVSILCFLHQIIRNIIFLLHIGRTDNQIHVVCHPNWSTSLWNPFHMRKCQNFLIKERFVGEFSQIQQGEKSI